MNLNKNKPLLAIQSKTVKGKQTNTLVVKSPSVVGKTQHLIDWLISEGIPFIMVRNKDDLRKLEVGITKVIIFDAYN